MTSPEPKTQEQRDAIRIRQLEIENEILKMRIGAKDHEIGQLAHALEVLERMNRIFMVACEQVGKIADAENKRIAAAKAEAPMAPLERKPPTAADHIPRPAQNSGDACRACGNFTLIRSGTCLTCQTCGETSGCS